MQALDTDIDELYAWIDTVPLSRPKKIIARDFADGVLLAEVIAYYIPKLVDLHNYPAAHSNHQKRDNWITLNRKVFNRLGIKLQDETINNLVEAKPGVIEQVLSNIRAKLEKVREGRSKSVYSNRAGTPDLTSLNDTDFLLPDVGKRSTQGYDSPLAELKTQNLSDIANANDLTSAKDLTKKVGDAGQTPESRSKRSSSNKTQQGYIVHHNLPQGCTRSSVGSIPSSGGMTNTRDDGAPCQIIYRGHKMVPLQLLDDKEKEMKSLETVNRSLTMKILRLETLVNIKDQRVEDLTHQIQNLRTMYERVCETSLAGVKS